MPWPACRARDGLTRREAAVNRGSARAACRLAASPSGVRRRSAAAVFVAGQDRLDQLHVARGRLGQAGFAPCSGTRSGGCASAAERRAAPRTDCRQPAPAPRRAPCRPPGRRPRRRRCTAVHAWPARRPETRCRPRGVAKRAAERARTTSTPAPRIEDAQPVAGMQRRDRQARHAAGSRAALPRQAAGSPRAPACGRGRGARSARPSVVTPPGASSSVTIMRSSAR